MRVFFSTADMDYMDWNSNDIIPPDESCRNDIFLFNNGCTIDPTEV